MRFELFCYAKGARTFERHIDIDDGEHPVSPYCSLPEQIDQWLKAFKKVKEMCGSSGYQRRSIPEKEKVYLDALVRGVYAVSDLPKGHTLGDNLHSRKNVTMDHLNPVNTRA